MKIPLSFRSFIRNTLSISPWIVLDATLQDCKPLDFSNPKQLKNRIESFINSWKSYLHALHTGHGSYLVYGGARYEGHVRMGLRHGHGILTWKTGEKHEGNFEYGHRHGQGILTYANGDIYEGNFEHNEVHGPGTLTSANGNKYEGNFEYGYRQGHGILTYANGDIYEGNFEHNEIHGHGTLARANGSKYEGNFENNTYHGQGILTSANGDVYEGNFEYSLLHGQGILTRANGSKYEGKWIKNWPGAWKENKDLFTFDKTLSTVSKPTTTPYNAIILQSTSDHNETFGLNQGHPKKLSKALKIGGYENQIIYFDTVEDFKENIERLNQKVNLVWIRAHGRGPAICCGVNNSEDINEKTLSKLNPLLRNDCFIVLEACRTGKPNMLAQKMLDILCAEEKNPTIIAPEGLPTWRGVDLAELKNGKLTVPMLELEKNTVKDTSTIFKCPK